jgi:hypothetical protein
MSVKHERIPKEAHDKPKGKNQSEIEYGQDQAPDKVTDEATDTLPTFPNFLPDGHEMMVP